MATPSPPSLAPLEPRDPTREELFDGPTRALPSEIQELAHEDTACTFCGVSYFVFSEVQALQATAKKYKKTFHDFVRFLERERRVAHDLREEVATLKRAFVQLGHDCALAVQQLGKEVRQVCSEHRRDLERLEQAQNNARESQAALQQLEQDAKVAEEHARGAQAVTEQKMRNEMLHLSTQIEKCRLDSSLQIAQLTEGLESARAVIREKEAQLQERQASWTAAERQAISERDQLKQNVLALSERVEAERESARELGAQLSAIKSELARVVAASTAERIAAAQLTSELIQLKRQLQNAEKSVSHVASERTQLEESHAKQQEELKTLHRLVEERASQLFVTTQNSDKIKDEYVRELEKLRKEHGDSINTLQRDHLRAIDELKRSQIEYLEYLKRETEGQRAQGESARRQAVETLELQMEREREQTKRWEAQVEHLARELEAERQKTALARQSADQEVRALRCEKINLQEEVRQLSSGAEAERSRSRQAVETAQREHLKDRQVLEKQMQELQMRVEMLETQLDQSPRTPQSAWPVTGRVATKRGGASSDDSHDNQRAEDDKTVAKLRRALEQKDQEIALLQQTVHRECLERTSLLEKLRSGKILPDMSPPPGVRSSEASFTHRSSVHPSSAERDSELDGEDRAGGTAPKASFYEQLRGRKKSKARK